MMKGMILILLANIFLLSPVESAVDIGRDTQTGPQGEFG